MKKTNYRPDIDGLRAIAVLAVVLYHLDIAFISGGFVGVDIFFVISGYLISSIIYTEIKTQQFSIHHFYIRRIRRIFPALFFIVLVTTIASFFILPKLQLREFSESITAVTWFVSNLFFWMNNDYFSVAAELKPLLHTWSLSVEEQFYVFFPLLMILLVNKYRYQILAGFFIVLFLCSLILSIYLSEDYSSANFYLAPTRAWEFLLGTFLAIGLLPEIRQKSVRQGVSLLGLGLIMASMLLLNENSVFPGVNAIYPVFGATLLIYAGMEKTAGTTEGYQPLVLTLLSNPVLRYIGLISYSLYLWHWPIISLLKNQTNSEFSTVEKALILLLTFMLSALSYHFIEQPFRHKTSLKKITSLKSGLIIMLMMSALGGGIHHYAKQTKVQESTQTLEELVTELLHMNNCFSKEETMESLLPCSFGDIHSNKVFFLWGDSHALAVHPAFVRLAEESGWRGIYASYLGCPPLFDVSVKDVKFCDGKVTNNIKKFLLNNKIDAIYIVARWKLYATGWIFNGRLMKPNGYVSDAETNGIDAETSTKVLRKALTKTLTFLDQEIDTSVNFLLPNPILPDLIEKYTPQSKHILTREGYIKQRSLIEDHVRQLTLSDRFHIIDPIDTFCPGEDCLLFNGDKAFYIDDNHLSPFESMSLFPLFEKALLQR